MIPRQQKEVITNMLGDMDKQINRNMPQFMLRDLSDKICNDHLNYLADVLVQNAFWNFVRTAHENKIYYKIFCKTLKNFASKSPNLYDYDLDKLFNK